MNFSKLFFDALYAIDVHEASFVIHNTKAERYLLQRIGFLLNKKSSQCSFARVALEYSNSEYLIPARVDLALIGQNDVPIVVVEAKYYYSFDEAFDNNDRIKIERDLKKLRQSNVDEAYFVLFIVHYGNEKVPKYFKYSKKHNKKNRSLKKATEYYTTKLFEHTNYKPFTNHFKLGEYKDIPIEMQVFITKVS